MRFRQNRQLMDLTEVRRQTYKSICQNPLETHQNLVLDRCVQPKFWFLQTYQPRTKVSNQVKRKRLL